MLRIPSPLSGEVERLIHDTIGCCIRVHRELGPGLFERVYAAALCVELAAALEQGNLFAATDLRTRMNPIWLAVGVAVTAVSWA